ncbi:MAG: hypothetical protein GC179_18150 [Anaerolineaceae bacterium]|nr:hypothetical protein [Anaerolineaceae bacterium]
MSSPNGKTLKQARLDRAHPPERVPYVTYWVRKILVWPRLTRIIIICVFALAVTALVFPLIDYVYMENFFNEQTIILPSFVSSGLGIITFGVGWWLLVGVRGEKRPERTAVFFYLVFGMLVLVVVFTLIINGYHVATLPDV